MPVLPRIRRAEVMRDGFGNRFERCPLGPDNRQQQPMRPPARKLRQHAGLEQRRLAGARCADHQQETCAALRAPGVQPLDNGAGLVVAAEVDCRVLRLEGVDARIGRPVRIKREPAGKFVGDRAKPLLQPLQATLIPIKQIDRLNVGKDEAFSQRLADDWQDDFAEGSRLREFGEAPLRGHPVRRQHQDDDVETGQFLVEAPLPVLTRVDAGRLVEIEEDALDKRCRTLPARPFRLHPAARRCTVCGAAPQ